MRSEITAFDDYAVVQLRDAREQLTERGELTGLRVSGEAAALSMALAALDPTPLLGVIIDLSGLTHLSGWTSKDFGEVMTWSLSHKLRLVLVGVRPNWRVSIDGRFQGTYYERPLIDDAVVLLRSYTVEVVHNA